MAIWGYRKQLYPNSLCYKEENIKFILALALPSIGESGCVKYLTKYGLKQFVDIFDKNRKPQYDDTEMNRFILDYFILWNKIKEYNVGENGKIYIKH
jgi:hypothetical protein